MKRLILAVCAVSVLSACESGRVRDNDNDQTVLSLSTAELREVGDLDGQPLPQVVKAMQSILNHRRTNQQSASAQGLARALDRLFEISCHQTCQIKEKQ